MADRNQKNLQTDLFHALSDNSFVPAVAFHDAEGTFRLDGTIHAKERSVNTLQVIHNFLMHRSQFLIQMNSSILVRLLHCDA